MFEEASSLAVLLIEDNDADAHLVREFLEESSLPDATIVRAIRLRSAIEHLKAQTFDVILLDLTLPDSRGAATFLSLRDSTNSLPPVIVMTGIQDEGLGIELVKHGAQDYLVKWPDDYTLVPRAIRYAVERSRLARRLAESATMYRSLVEQVPAVIYRTEPEDIRRILYVSPQIESMLGYTPTEWLAGAESWTNNVHPEDRERVRSDGRGTETEYRMLTREGRTIWVHDKRWLVRDENGRPLFIQGIVTDITVQKEQEERFRALVQNATDVTLVLGTDGIVRYVSPSVLERLSYAPEDLVGKTLLDLVHPADSETVRETMADVARSERSEQLFIATFRMRDGTGQWRVMEMTASNLTQHSAIEGIVANARDITERRQREIELEALVSVATQLSGATSPDEVIGSTLENLVELEDVRGAAFVHIGPESENAYIEQATGAWSHAAGTWIPGDDIPRSIRAHENQEVFVANDTREQGIFRSDIYHGTGAIAAIPLAADNVMKGLLLVGQDTPFPGEHVRLLGAIGNMVAGALHRATLRNQAVAQLHRLAALHAVDRAITSTLDLSLRLEVLLNNVRSLLEVDAATILLLDQATLSLRHAASQGFYSPDIKQSTVRLGQGFAGAAALNRQVLEIPRIEAEQRRHLNPEFSELLTRESVATYYAFPLIARGEIKGVLELFHRSVVRRDTEWYDFVDTLTAQAAIAIDHAALFEELQRSNVDLTLAYDANIDGWARALDLRDHETEGHSRRVTAWTVRLARALGVSDSELTHIQRGALLHDIGKMGVPDSILLKPGPLTDDEWRVMRQHPLLAYDLLAPIPYLRQALDIPYCHHERWDGTGYPRGLAGEQIPLAARIFAVVDVWDALSSDRPYRKAWPTEKVISYLREQAGTQFDPTVVDAFLRLFSDRSAGGG